MVITQCVMQCGVDNLLNLLYHVICYRILTEPQLPETTACISNNIIMTKKLLAHVRKSIWQFYNQVFISVIHQFDTHQRWWLCFHFYWFVYSLWLSVNNITEKGWKGWQYLGTLLCQQIKRTVCYFVLSDGVGMQMEAKCASVNNITDTVSMNFQNTICDFHYSEVIMSAMASQITGVSLACSTVFAGADKKKTSKLSSRHCPFLRGIHQQPANYPHKVPVTWKMFPFHGVIILGEVPDRFTDHGDKGVMVSFMNIVS